MIQLKGKSTKLTLVMSTFDTKIEPYNDRIKFTLSQFTVTLLIFFP
jgi:hypothetical protein